MNRSNTTGKQLVLRLGNNVHPRPVNAQYLPKLQDARHVSASFCETRSVSGYCAITALTGNGVSQANFSGKPTLGINALETPAVVVSGFQGCVSEVREATIRVLLRNGLAHKKKRKGAQR
jgi:hypothetical protein